VLDHDGAAVTGGLSMSGLLLVSAAMAAAQATTGLERLVLGGRHLPNSLTVLWVE
jgi:hypothetical protein